MDPNVEMVTLFSKGLELPSDLSWPCDPASGPSAGVNAGGLWYLLSSSSSLSSSFSSLSSSSSCWTAGLLWRSLRSSPLWSSPPRSWSRSRREEDENWWKSWAEDKEPPPRKKKHQTLNGLYVTFFCQHSAAHLLPVLNGLEEQEEEEQLLPALPVFLLRWPWLCELSFLDFPSPSLLLWWLEEICINTHKHKLFRIQAQVLWHQDSQWPTSSSGLASHTFSMLLLVTEELRLSEDFLCRSFCRILSLWLWKDTHKHNELVSLSFAICSFLL